MAEISETLGNWSAELKSDNAQIIRDKLLGRSVEMFKACKASKDQIAEAQVSLARFCDLQYKQMMEYTESKEYEDKKTLKAQISGDYDAM